MFNCALKNLLSLEYNTTGNKTLKQFMKTASTFYLHQKLPVQREQSLSTINYFGGTIQPYTRSFLYFVKKMQKIIQKFFQKLLM